MLPSVHMTIWNIDDYVAMSSNADMRFSLNWTLATVAKRNSFTIKVEAEQRIHRKESELSDCVSYSSVS